jgi:2-oxoisovalerate dehydrogenase E1 component alpha subunit
LGFLDTDGNLPIGPCPQCVHDRELCAQLFSYMLRLRIFDQQVLALQRAGRILFCNPNTGEEAAQIGSAAALQPGDWVFPSYRVAGVYLYRKQSPLLLLHQLYANARDLSQGNQLPMHFGDKEACFLSVSSPIGTQITQAVGFSLGAKLKRSRVVAIAYFGDGASSCNDFHGGLNLAGVLNTPTIFFCVNNQYALSLPVAKQTASETLAAKGASYGIRSEQVDGNDVVAVYDAVQRAAEHARNGGGPVLIEAVTYRMGLHSSSDDPYLYRSREEEERWKPRDPLLRFRRFLQRRGWWSTEWEDGLMRNYTEEMQAAILEAEVQPGARPANLFENVYAEPTPALQSQRRAAAAILFPE